VERRQADQLNSASYSLMQFVQMLWQQPGNQAASSSSSSPWLPVWHRHFCMHRMVAFFGVTKGDELTELEAES